MVIKILDLQEAFIHHARSPRPSFQKGQCRCFMTGALWYNKEEEKRRRGRERERCQTLKMTGPRVVGRRINSPVTRMNIRLVAAKRFHVSALGQVHHIKSMLAPTLLDDFRVGDAGSEVPITAATKTTRIRMDGHDYLLLLLHTKRKHAQSLTGTGRLQV